MSPATHGQHGSSPRVVAVVVPTLLTGGAEKQALALMRNLDPSRWRPVVFCLHEGGPLYEQARADGFESIVLGSRSGADPRVIWPLARMLRDSGASVVLCRGFSATTHGRIAARLAGIRVTVVAEHSSEDIGRRGVMKRWMDALLARRTSAWVAVTASQKPYLIAEKNVRAERLHVIPNGVEVPDRIVTRQQARTALRIPDESTVFGTISVVRPEKDHKTLISAFTEIVDTVADAVLLIGGDGPSMPDVRAAVQESRHADKIVLLGAVSDVWKVLPAIDVYVCSSLTEAMPISVVEAMTVGLPVVSTDVGGVPELLGWGELGRLVPPNNAALLSASMAELGTDPSVARNLGHQAQLSASAYSAKTMAESYQSLFDELVSQAEAGSA